jgi:N-acetylmuramic acid 6-phosphate (MurNAc-6-P) etherase
VARAALDEAGGRTKLAVLLLHGFTLQQAAARLAGANGQLGAALRDRSQGLVAQNRVDRSGIGA